MNISISSVVIDQYKCSFFHFYSLYLLKLDKNLTKYTERTPWLFS